ncbi:MAG TPA: hypothetical protein VKG25_29045 [Bryobacteraceae bacterium]|nr:hypothetical protein [Bryobacteraceae bacterium]
MPSKLHRLLAGAALASALFALPLSAQSWIRVTTSGVKPENIQEYEGYVKQISAGYKKAGIPFNIVYQVLGGNLLEYTSVSPVAKFADLEGPNPLAKAMGAEAFGNLVNSINRCRTSNTRYFALTWDDAGIIKGELSSQYWMRTRVPIEPGKFNDYRAFLKGDYRAALDKAGITQFRVNQPIFGAPPGTVETVRMMKGLGEIDDGPVLTKALGQAAADALNAKARTMTRGPAQTTIIRIRTDLSLLPAQDAGK